MTTPQPTLPQVIQWAKEAGAIAKAGVELEHTVHMKGALDLATEIDHACEKALMEHIQSEFPSHAIVAEESGESAGDPEHCWYIDPLDGTLNYNHRLPIYAVSIAYAYKGKMELGGVYVPERDECFSAQAGKGAWLNDKPIHVSACSSLQAALFSAGVPSWDEAKLDHSLAIVRRLSLNSQGIRRMGSVAVSLCSLACGRTDGHIDISSTPWDIAASALIVQEAGGLLTSFEGDPQYFKPPYSLVAVTPGISEELRSLLIKN